MSIRTFLHMLLVASLLFQLVAVAAQQHGAEVAGVRIQDAITPVVSDFTANTLAAANAAGAKAVILQIDTPGGLDSAMRQMIQAILESQAPVIVYVAPSGARAASAGAIIALAADFVAMAPGTSMGAAHPVAVGGRGGGEDSVMKDKVLNDAVSYARSLAQQRGRDPEAAAAMVRLSASHSAREALDLGLSDLVAGSAPEVLEKLSGRRYLRAGQPHILELEGARVVWAQMNWRQEVLSVISNPNVAYLLMMLGMLGIFFEISQPGVILPGVLGAVAILLALFGFQALPVNYVGFLLIVLALVFFILEVKVVSFGMLTVAGIAAMSLGSIMLIDSHEPFLRISRAVIAGTVGSVSLLSLLVLSLVARTQRRVSVSGAEAMVGELARVQSVSGDRLRVLAHGELWNAIAEEGVEENQAVRIRAVREGMLLQVEPLSEDGEEEREPLC